MEDSQKIFRWKTQITEPTIINQQTIQLESQFLLIRLPFGGYVWHRPTAVLIGQPGNPTRISIKDPTRTALIVLACITFLFNLINNRKK
jgi:hypothetical protein